MNGIDMLVICATIMLAHQMPSDHRERLGKIALLLAAVFIVAGWMGYQ